MARVNFNNLKQREFLDLVIDKMNSPSLRGLLQFGVPINYSTLKNYYNGERRMPFDFFEDLCRLAGLDTNYFDFIILEDNWGMIKGGKIGKRT